MATYLRGLETAKKQDYAAADRIFERISPAFSVFWAGYYLQGATKLALGQSAQAETILAKYLGRVPDDLKAGRLIPTAPLQHRSPPLPRGDLTPRDDKVPASPRPPA